MRNLDSTFFTLRLTRQQAVRWWEMMDLAKSRDPYIDKSDFNRELLGLVEAKVLTIDEIEYFRTGKKS